MAFGPGSIAFVGSNANDTLAFVVLEPVLAGSVITFTDNEWNGASFNTGEATWTWTADSNVPAGTIVTMSGRGASASSDIGVVAFEQSGGTGSGSVYAYARGVDSSIAFLAAVSGSEFSPAMLANTGLVAGQTAMTLPASAPVQRGGASPVNALPAAEESASEPTPVDQPEDEQTSEGSEDGEGEDKGTSGNENENEVSSPDEDVPANEEASNAEPAAFGTDGDDVVVLNEDSIVTGAILLGAGNDSLTAVEDLAIDLVIDGGEGDDVITTGAGDDVILGGIGGDVIDGRSGDDVIDGGAGDDILKGGEGDDRLLGGEGNDLLAGGAGDDVIYGDAGTDTADYSDDEAGITADLSDGVVFGDDAGADTLVYVENVTGGSGDDTLLHGAGANVLDGGAGDDHIVVGGGDTAIGGEGNDEIEVVGGSTGTATVDAGTGSDTITIRDGGVVGSALTLNEEDRLVIEAGGKLVANNAVIWSGGDVVVENAGLIEGSRVLQTTAGVQGDLVFSNLAGGTVQGVLTPQQAGASDATITVNNAGVIEAGSGARVIDFRSFDAAGASATINNLAGGIIRNVGASDDSADVIRPGQNGTINNWGTIIAADGLVGGGDLIDFQGDAGGKVNNYAGGHMEGAKHAVTGEKSVTVVNDGTMIGRNGSAVNIDNDGTEAEKVFITNRGTMEGRSAELADSDGDAIDVDGLVQVLNYGRIAGMGAEGYHDGEPNVSEGLAIGGGTILNYGADAVIYGYGRAIQVDNSSNENALGTTFINNDGLIQGDGNGPEGVDPEDAAEFDLRGNEAINLVGDYADEILNQSTGRIIGGIAMGGGNDRLSNSGLMRATGGTAIDMGDGDDVVNLYVGSVVEGEIRLGAGNDRITMNSGLGGVLLDAGDGNDDITTSSGDDVIYGGAGDDYIYAAEGNDTIFAGEGDDTILADLGNDIIDGGAGYDTLFLARATGPISVDFAAGRVSAEGIGTDTFTNIENLQFGAGNDTILGGNGDDSFDGGDGNDTLKGGAGDDTLSGSAGDDTVEGGSGDDVLSGGIGSDILNGGSGDDEIDGGEGNDRIDAGSGDDVIVAGAGNDIVLGGSGDDRIEGGAGNDTLSAGSGHDAFIFASGFGHDTITDFRTSGSSSDVLEFDTDLFADFASAIAAADQVGCDVVFTFDANNTLTLEGVSLASLQADDFRFA